MAESKSALIAKSVQKHAGRAKEKLLQNLGKVDRTLDDIFEEHLQNFNRQHQQATRLQKEFNNYIRCIRAAQTASKSLMEAITEVYESGWSGHDLLYVQAQNMEMLWQDFSHKLGDQVLIPLNTYTNQFPETRKKVEKRGRKLVDYDSQRHSFQNLQANAAKRRDDVKVTRGREQLEEAKRTYEALNSELHDELPALYDSRVLFYIDNLQTLFSAELLFHKETSKVYEELEAITDKLANECQRGSYNKKSNSHNANNANNANNAISAINAVKTSTLPHAHNGSNVQTPPSSPPNGEASPSSSPSPPRERKLDDKLDVKLDAKLDAKLDGKLDGKLDEKLEDKPAEVAPAELPTLPTLPVTEKVEEASDKKVEELYDIPVEKQAKPANEVNDASLNEKDKEKTSEEVYDVPVGATLAGLPAGVLYRVRATYRYAREDADELSFEVGDVIRVVEYDDPEEQEEGWLMGVKESTNEKGMFPANFTRPI